MRPQIGGPCHSSTRTVKLSKALATRLKEVIYFLIGTDQSYCVPERSIYDIFLVRDLISLGRTTSPGFGLLLFDQEKAFDGVNHSFLFAVLRRTVFGKKILSC